MHGVVGVLAALLVTLAPPARAAAVFWTFTGFVQSVDTVAAPGLTRLGVTPGTEFRAVVAFDSATPLTPGFISAYVDPITFLSFDAADYHSARVPGESRIEVEPQGGTFRLYAGAFPGSGGLDAPTLYAFVFGTSPNGGHLPIFSPFHGIDTQGLFVYAGGLPVIAAGISGVVVTVPEPAVLALLALALLGRAYASSKPS